MTADPDIPTLRRLAENVMNPEQSLPLSLRVEAAEAGSKRQRARSLACVHALKSALAFALERKEVCERARDRLKTEKPDEPYWHMSEQCAAHEARHIADKLAKLLKEVDRDFRKIPPRLRHRERER